MALVLGTVTINALKLGAQDVTAAYLGSTLVFSSVWTPAQLPSLVLWLDADDASTITLNGSNVSQWNDKSGNARHASQTTASAQPTNPIDLNNRRVIQFDGFDDFLSVPEFTTSATVFILANRGQATYPQLSGADPGSFIPTWNVNGERLEYRSVSTQTILSEIAGGSTAAYAFGCVQLDTANDEVKLNIYGGSVTTFSQSLNSSDLKINTIGRDFAGAQQVTDGAVAEIITLNNLPSTEDRQKVEGYLAWKWGGLAFDADAQAYIDAVELADGQPLENSVKVAINDFVVGCKADGIWSAIKASCILAGARTLTGALTPLVGTAPTNFNFVSGDYNRKTGLVGDGSTKYLDSNRAGNADPQNNKHLSVYGTSLEIGGIYIGAYSESTKMGALFSLLSNNFYFNNNISNSDNSFVTGLSLSGVHGFAGSSRSASMLTTGRRAGSNYTSTVASVAPSSETYFVFGLRGLNSPKTTSRLAFYSIGESLDLALLDARVSTLMTYLGAAIP